MTIILRKIKNTKEKIIVRRREYKLILRYNYFQLFLFFFKKTFPAN